MQLHLKEKFYWNQVKYTHLMDGYFNLIIFKHFLCGNVHWTLKKLISIEIITIFTGWKKKTRNFYEKWANEKEKNLWSNLSIFWQFGHVIRNKNIKYLWFFFRFRVWFVFFFFKFQFNLWNKTLSFYRKVLIFMNCALISQFFCFLKFKIKKIKQFFKIIGR